MTNVGEYDASTTRKDPRPCASGRGCSGVSSIHAIRVPTNSPRPMKNGANP